jgi:hypothetical protein
MQQQTLHVHRQHKYSAELAGNLANITILDDKFMVVLHILMI